MKEQFKSYDEAYNNCGDFIVKKTDVFTQSLIVESVTYFLNTLSDYYAKGYPPLKDGYSWMLLPHKMSRWAGIQYKSNPSGEEFSLVCYEKNVSTIIININNNTNIVLQDEGGFYHYPINKTDFIKCCNAKSLSMRGGHSDIIQFEESCDDFILYFQAIYNEVIDNTKYMDATKVLKDKYHKDLEAFKNFCDDKIEKNRKEAREETRKQTQRIVWGLLLFFIGMPVALLGFISMDSGGDGLFWGILGSISTVVGLGLISIYAWFND